MFGRKQRKDAPDPTGQARATEPIVTAATEPVLPPPPPTAPPVAAFEPPMPAPPVEYASAPSPVPEAESDSLSQADIRARTLLADSIARMESRLSQPETTPPPPMPAPAYAPAAASGAVEALAQSVAQTASEVARALEQMSSMCAMLAERLDADREERRVLTEAIARLGVTPLVATDAPSNVLGGIVSPAPPVERDDDITIIDDVAPVAPAIVLAAIEVEHELEAETEIEPQIAVDPSPSASMFAAPPIAREREALYVDDTYGDTNGAADTAPSTSFFAAPPAARDVEISIVEEDEISIVEDDDPVGSPISEPVGAGMWCRDDDQWIGGVEIADFVSDNGTIRYWLRRTSDGRMLPRPFDATDLRFVRETSPADG